MGISGEPLPAASLSAILPRESRDPHFISKTDSPHFTIHAHSRGTPIDN
jgi:hypothetical protein